VLLLFVVQCEVIIEALGAGGDGIARHDGARLFVAGALPGERIRVALGAAIPGGRRAEMVERLTESSQRSVAPCEYFGDCGGCVAQHIAAQPYAEWKIAVIREALAHRGLRDIAIEPLIASLPASRRRARFAVTQQRGGPRKVGALGFRRRGSEQVIAIERCTVLSPALETLLNPLRGLAAEMEFAEVSLTQAHEGIDVVLHGCGAAPGLKARERLAAFAHAHRIQRLSAESLTAERKGRGARKSAGKGKQRRPAPVLETIAQPGAVRACFKGVWVDLPPGAFLQPTAAGEGAIQRLVRGGLALEDHPLGKSKRGARIADLYAGLGGIGFALASDNETGAPRHEIAMFEGGREMVEAADAAARNSGLSVTATLRDLARRPLSATELKPYDAVVFDPPRAGARAQAEALAASNVARIAAVSCNAASFARDARILIDGGYRMIKLTPIDQFLWSSLIELVAIFCRDDG